jgi:hypothetical protein
MEIVLAYLPLLGCAAMMAVCVGLMGGARRRRRPAGEGPAGEPPEAPDAEVAALREEVARLRAERGEEARRLDG